MRHLSTKGESWELLLNFIDIRTCKSQTKYGGKSVDKYLSGLLNVDDGGRILLFFFSLPVITIVFEL